MELFCEWWKLFGSADAHRSRIASGGRRHCVCRVCTLKRRVALRMDGTRSRYGGVIGLMSMIQHGKNCSALVRGGTGEEVLLEKGGELQVARHGDHIVLVVGLGITLTVYTEDEEESPSSSVSIECSGDSGSLEHSCSSISLPTKRRYIDLSADASEGSTAAKRMRSTSPESTELDESEADGRAQPAFSIAMPSLSTGVFKFDIARAARVAVEVICDFLERERERSVRIYLVDVVPGSVVLSAFSEAYRAELDRRGMEYDRRFQCLAANICQMSTNGTPCAFVVNAANWRFSPKGSGVNRALHDACGEGVLHSATKALYPHSAECGEAYLVPLPEHCALTLDQGVRNVIQCLGPNMNRNRPQCLKGDYEKGERLLRSCYANILHTFATTAGLDARGIANSSGETGATVETTVKDASMASAFDVLMKPKVSAARTSADGRSGRGGGSSGGKRGGGRWQDALLSYIRYPDSCEEIIHRDDTCIAIVDKYPKAKLHLLVIPFQEISGPSALRKEHLELLQHMYRFAQDVIDKVGGANAPVKCGFHAVPSMSQLHMHVISDDMDSPALKHKKHWNSFTTSFFLDVHSVLEQLEKRGALQHAQFLCSVGRMYGAKMRFLLRVQIDKHHYEAILKNQMVCHRCGQSLRNMTVLKQHNADCRR